MKVLSVAWTIYDDRLQDFMGNCTGGGLVIKNVCEYIGKKEESYLLLGKKVLPEIKLDNITIVKTDYNPEMKNVKGDNSNYISYMTLVFEKAVQEIQPDIINFHGYGEWALACIKNVCLKKKLPYVVTEHLFISRADTFGGYRENVELADVLYRIPGIKIIAVSSGMKKKIGHDFPEIPESNVQVILNGTDFCAEQVLSDYREKYGLGNKKILLCVGTILERKNQMQLVSVYSKLPEELKQNLKIVFCGNESAAMKGKLQEAIRKAGLENELLYVGAMSSEDMKKMYSIADGLVMPSMAEGLSIAALEAIAYGLPVIMFADSECAEDLNDEKVVAMAFERSDEGLMAAIVEWFNKNWDKEYIRKYAKYFTMERMADDYLKYYKTRIENK